MCIYLDESHRAYYLSFDIAFASSKRIPEDPHKNQWQVKTLRIMVKYDSVKIHDSHTPLFAAGSYYGASRVRTI